jgi:hypothetical protein
VSEEPAEMPTEESAEMPAEVPVPEEPVPETSVSEKPVSEKPVPEEPVSEEPVSEELKAIAFGLAYGGSAYGLSSKNNIPIEEAKEMMDKYFDTFSGVKQYSQDCQVAEMPAEEPEKRAIVRQAEFSDIDSEEKEEEYTLDEVKADLEFLTALVCKALSSLDSLLELNASASVPKEPSVKPGAPVLEQFLSGWNAEKVFTIKDVMTQFPDAKYNTVAKHVRQMVVRGELEVDSIVGGGANVYRITS